MTLQQPESGSSQGQGSTDPRVLLFMTPGRNRELLADTLGGQYSVDLTTDEGRLEDDFDCCIMDPSQFEASVETIEARREAANPCFLPFLILLDQDTADQTRSSLWERVDDVVTLPVGRSELLTRVENLVERRLTSVKLVERERQLEDTIDDLRTKEQAMDQAPIGITIARIEGDDSPLVYANQGFRDLTGYAEDIIGRDCRFLQGGETDPATKREIRQAIDASQDVSVDIVNYRRNGQKFWNKLDIAPITTDDEIPRFVGFQTDITERKIRERRLQVLNRVLSHNLRNKMNIIEGHIELMRAELDDEVSSRSLSIVEENAAELLRLGESARDIQRILSSVPSDDHDRIDLGEELHQLVGALGDRFTSARIELSLPDDDLSVAVPGLIEAIEEATVNAVKHNDTDTPSVEIRVSRQSDQWLDIEIEDDGPGIPSREREVLEAGETDLRHADRLGIWMIHWVARRVGGSLSFAEAEPRGTILKINVPTEP